MEIVKDKNVLAHYAVPMIDKADNNKYKSGETVADEAFSKDGAGAWTSLAIADTFTEIGTTGLYEADLTDSEQNHDQIFIKLTAANSADQGILITTIPQPANMKKISDDAGAADNLEDILDGTGGNIKLSAAGTSPLLITNSGGPGITVSGTTAGIQCSATNGDGDGITFTGGSTGNGIRSIGGTGIAGISTATNGDGIKGFGSGSGHGIHGVAGPTGNGIRGTGGATSGSGIMGLGVSGNGSGIEGQGEGTGDGVKGTGGASGHGIHGIGGATIGNGLRGDGSGNQAGINGVGNGSGSGLQASGGTTGNGILAQSGSGATGDAMKLEVLSTDGTGLNAIGKGTGSGIKGLGILGPGIEATSASGGGLKISATSSGAGLRIIGDTHGIQITTTAGSGIKSTGGIAGPGLELIGGSNVAGLISSGTGTGDGALFRSGTGTTGNGITSTSLATDGDGMQLNKAGTGKDLNAGFVTDVTAILADTVFTDAVNRMAIVYEFGGPIFTVAIMLFFEADRVIGDLTTAKFWCRVYTATGGTPSNAAEIGARDRVNETAVTPLPTV